MKTKHIAIVHHVYSISCQQHSPTFVKFFASWFFRAEFKCLAHAVRVVPKCDENKIDNNYSQNESMSSTARALGADLQLCTR